MVKQPPKPQAPKPRQQAHKQQQGKQQAPKLRQQAPKQQQKQQQQQQDDQTTGLIKKNSKTVNPVLPRSPSIINTPRGYSPVGSFADILRTMSILGRRSQPRPHK
jgi:hypothetical protein